MAYTDNLVDLAREIISATHNNVVEKKMFGGLCFMVNDKMCVGVRTERFMFRLSPDIFDEVVEKEGCEPMVMRGKVMRNFVYVDVTALNTKKKLSWWINLALEYNKIAKPSKKKKS